MSFFYAKKRKEFIMKKLLIGVLLAGLMTGCGANEKAKDTKEAANTDKLPGILADGKLTVATSADFAPYEFYDGKNIVGIDPEIVKAIGEKLKVEVEINDMDFNNIIASIGSGRADIGAAGMTVDSKRLENVDFTNTYASSTQIFLIKKDMNIKSKDDLKDKTIGCQLGTVGNDLADKEFKKVSAFAKYPDAVLALQNGKIDAILMDQTSAEKFVEANDDLKIMESGYESEDYAFAIGKKEDEAKDLINKAIKELQDDGTIEKILKKYK